MEPTYERVPEWGAHPQDQRDLTTTEVCLMSLQRFEDNLYKTNIEVESQLKTVQLELELLMERKLSNKGAADILNKRVAATEEERQYWIQYREST